MIRRLKGTIVDIGLKSVVIDVSGVGYLVSGIEQEIARLNHGDFAEFWIRTVVREDAFDLYGFENKNTLDFFELLITVSGIGPKSALGILNSTTSETILEAITTGETGYLTKIAGIGKKMAEKIVLELKDKAGIMHIANGGTTSARGQSDVDAIEGLKSLGYNHKEARQALEDLPKDIVEAGAKIRAALKILGKK